jgi:hypothetical protein
MAADAEIASLMAGLFQSLDSEGAVSFGAFVLSGAIEDLAWGSRRGG